MRSLYYVCSLFFPQTRHGSQRVTWACEVHPSSFQWKTMRKWAKLKVCGWVSSSLWQNDFLRGKQTEGFELHLMFAKGPKCITIAPLIVILQKASPVAQENNSEVFCVIAHSPNTSENRDWCPRWVRVAFSFLLLYKENNPLGLWG